MKPISEGVSHLLKNILNKKDPILAEIIINWAKIAGAKFSRTAIPVKISKSREKSNLINILHVETTNAAFAMEMSFQQDIIIERITIYLGFKAVHRLKLLTI